MRRWFWTFVVFGFSLPAIAQYNLLDTFRIYLKKEPSFYFSLDGRNSFIRNEPAQIDGVRFGFSFGNKIRLLGGMYRLRKTITREYLYAPGTPSEEKRFQENKLSYFGITCDYVVYNRKRWKLTIPVQTGFGFGDRLERNQAGLVQVDQNFKFVPFEVSLNASFRLLPWFHLGAGIGYRYALFSTIVSSDFSAPIYTYGFGIDVEWFWNQYLKEPFEKKYPRR